jgi:hypothetical protein
MHLSKYQRNSFLRRGKAIVLLLLMFVGVNSVVFFGGRTLLPITSTPGIMMPPYGYTGPSVNSLSTIDPWASMNQDYTFDAYATQSIRHGIMPFWSPYQGLGQPFLANGVSAVFYPLYRLHLILPPAWWDVVYMLNWFLAAIFLYMYLRLVNVQSEAALVGGAAIFASGFFQSYLLLRCVPAAAAWWPLLLYGVERAIQQPAWRWRHLVLAFAIYCTLTGGHPEVTFLSLCVVVVYALVRLAMQGQHAWRALWAVVPGACSGLFLAAPMWVNFVQYAFTAYSAHQAGSLLGQMHLAFTTAATYIFPYLYGRMHTIPFGLIDGWNWNLYPGWLPATGLFLALVSLTTAIKKPCRWGVGFLWGAASISGAKIWGIPGINALGRLPLFERIMFPRYAAFLLTFALAGLATVGVRTVSKFAARQWRIWLGVWVVLIATLFAMSLYPIWPIVQQSAVGSPPTLTLVVFGGLGLAWAIVGPLGLWWLMFCHPHERQLLYFVAALGILLQGAAYAPAGYSSQTYAILSAVCLSLYIVVVLGIGLVRTIQPSRLLVMAGCLCVALPPLGAALMASYGLAARYNPLTPAPYLNKLIMLQNSNLYRSYSLGYALQANFAAPFAITSLNNIDPIAPADSAAFVQRYLDRGASPFLFLGLAGPNAQFPALKEFWHNKRYFDLIGVRYLITQATDPRPVLYETEAFGAKKDVAPLFQPLEMSIVCPTDTLSRIQVLLGTYGRKNPGTVTLQVFSSDGVLLQQHAIDAASLPVITFQEFQFPPIQGMKDRPLRLRLEFAPAQSDSMIAAWTYPDQLALGFALRVVDYGAELTLLYEDFDTQVRVWENRSAVPRVFLAPRGTVTSSAQEALTRLQDTPDLTRQVWIEQGPEMATTWPEAQSPGELHSFSLAPNTVSVQYQARTSGILTLTDSYAEGWHATLNGREVPVLRVDGVFRGIRIGEPGTQEVYFWYRPPYWTFSLGMAGAGFLLMTGASFLDWRRLAE